MRLNRKGEGGFMESVLAVMVVVISLTAFLSFLALSVSQDHDGDPFIPNDLLDDVRIVGGCIEADLEDRMYCVIERYGYDGMKIILEISDGIYHSSLTQSAGSCDSDRIFSKNGLISVRTDDGRSVPVRYSVAVWS